MSNLEFAVGKRVVCVDDAGLQHLPSMPYRGGVYTIKAILERREGLGFTFEELPDPQRIIPHKEGWYAHRFRPVRETSIDCFTALLEKPPVKQTEAA